MQNHLSVSDVPEYAPAVRWRWQWFPVFPTFLYASRLQLHTPLGRGYTSRHRSGSRTLSGF